MTQKAQPRIRSCAFFVLLIVIASEAKNLRTTALIREIQPHAKLPIPTSGDSTLELPFPALIAHSQVARDMRITPSKTILLDVP